jgi:hypothetical protein
MVLALVANEQATGGTDWGTVAAFIAAGAAVVALIIDGFRRRRQLGIDNMWRLVERWDQPLLRSTRAAAARALLADRTSGDLSPEARDVLNIFELLAYLVVTSKSLPVRDAWVNFSAHAIFWWNACLQGIEAERAAEPTAYEEFAKLFDAFRRYEKKRGIPEWHPSKEDLTSFLQGEAALDDEGRREIRVSWPVRRRIS